MIVVLATGNAQKVHELMALLAEHGITGSWPELTSPIEDGATYEDNAIIKARAAAEAIGTPALGDDAGLEVDALGGAPGLFTRRWADDLGGWTAARAVLGAHAGSRARFHAALAMAWPDGRVLTARGTTEGRIVPATVEGFGLEPCFQADGTNVPLPVLPDEIRATVHYRVRAMRALMKQVDGVREY